MDGIEEREELTLEEAREEALLRAYADYLNGDQEALKRIKTFEAIAEFETNRRNFDVTADMEQQKIDVEKERLEAEKKTSMLRAAVDGVKILSNVICTGATIAASNGQLKSVQLFEETGCFTSEGNKRRLSLPKLDFWNK